MDNCEYGKAVSYAIVFQQQIFRKQEEANEKSWKWETYFPRTLSNEEIELIMGIAGCWYEEDESNDRIRFYSSEKHPAWIRKKMIYMKEGDKGGCQNKRKNNASLDSKHGRYIRSIRNGIIAISD
ncbi:MAG: hypothetical protein IKS56_03760 [Lachnospiraceae bacterium]|nr:hypothetical protein [Lachnospiraceae bacterium]